MDLRSYFPIFNKLSPRDQDSLLALAAFRTVPKGTLLHNGSADCTGLMLIQSGQLRAYITSDEGREVTLYRLFEHDLCLFSASCILRSIQFDLSISAEKETSFWLIPPDFYKGLMERNVEAANYTNEIMAARFTDVMWLMEQIMWKSFDKRLASFLLEESDLCGDPTIATTHEQIASHMGTAREVVTRMLKYFQSEGMVRLTRGAVTLLDFDRLHTLAGG